MTHSRNGGPWEGQPVKTTIQHHDYMGTDELFVEFYECPICLFERVPYVKHPIPEWAQTIEGQTKYCPSCAAEITWAFDEPSSMLME